MSEYRFQIPTPPKSKKKKGDRQGRNSIVRLQQRSADQGTQHDRNPDQSGSHGNSQIKTKIRKAGTSSSPNHPPADYRLPANLGPRSVLGGKKDQRFNQRRPAPFVVSAVQCVAEEGERASKEKQTRVVSQCVSSTKAL